ncbi:aminotransferase class IV [Chloroflexota bacterium]
MSESKKGCVYINGEYFSLEEAKISVFDRAFWGINVYDGLGLYKGYVFKVKPHIDRFFQSLKTAMIPPRLSKDELKEVMFETVRRSGFKDLAFILTIGTGGTPPPGYLEASTEPTLIVSVFEDKPRPYHLSPEKILRDGIRVRISSIRNIPQQCIDLKIKQFNRLHHYLAQQETKAAGADDTILLDIYGNVSEGTYANVWIAKDGSLYTPGPGGLLHGITRATIFEIAHKEGIAASEIIMSPYDLYNADEVFFSSTAGGTIPIVEVDGRTVGDGVPGPLSKRMLDIWEQMHTDPKYATLVVK